AALTNAGDEQIRVAIVIEVGYGDAHSVELDIQARAVCYICERPVPIVTIEMHGCALPLVAGPIHSVNQQNVQPAIGVIIEESASRTECFGKILAPESAAVVRKAKTGGFCHIREAKRGRRFGAVRSQQQRGSAK